MPVQTRETRRKRQRTEEDQRDTEPVEVGSHADQANQASQQAPSADRRYPLQEILDGLKNEQARQLGRNQVYNQANASMKGQIEQIVRQLATQGDNLLLQAALFKDLKQTTERQQQQIHHLQMKVSGQENASHTTGSLLEAAGSRELQTADELSITQNTVAPGDPTLEEEEADLRDRFTRLLSRRAHSTSDREDFKLWVEATLESLLDMAMEAADNRWGSDFTDSEANGTSDPSLRSIRPL